LRGPNNRSSNPKGCKRERVWGSYKLPGGVWGEAPAAIKGFDAVCNIIVKSFIIFLPCSWLSGARGPGSLNPRFLHHCRHVVLCYDQNPLDTFPRASLYSRGSYQLVADLLATRRTIQSYFRNENENENYYDLEALQILVV